MTGAPDQAISTLSLTPDYSPSEISPDSRLDPTTVMQGNRGLGSSHHLVDSGSPVMKVHDVFVLAGWASPDCVQHECEPSHHSRRLFSQHASSFVVAA